jgi:tRNA pseudouridine38-40 synthase
LQIWTTENLNATRIRAAVEYDGTDFCGFQRQPSVRTVAGVLESALEEIFGEYVPVTGAGRTDSGVHATGQVISFSCPRPFPRERLALALNRILPRDVNVRDAIEVGGDFSARFSATSRTYMYAILNRREPSSLLARYAWHVRKPLDIEAMQAAGEHLLGERDFRSFCALPESGRTTRTVLSLGIERIGDIVRVDVVADAFLRHMVRAIVGTLVECGHGRRGPASVEAILVARDRATAGVNAPPQGLYLAGVRYPSGYDSYKAPWIAAGP